MTFRERSLALKLLLVVGAILVFVSAGYLTVSSFSLHQVESNIIDGVSQEVSAQITHSVEAKTEKITLDVENFINQAFLTPDNLAQQITASINGDISPALTRDQVSLMAANALKHSQTSATYIQFEANKFDGKDSDYASGYLHSVQGAGTFEPYFVKEEGGNISQLAIESADEKYDDTITENGSRASEFFLCPKEKRSACILNPYLYEIRPGYSELMTSLVVPVLSNGQFLGMVGADLNLPVLQTKATSLKQSLYNGHSEVFIISHDGFIAASTQTEDKLGKPFNSAFEQASKLMSNTALVEHVAIGNMLYFVKKIKVSKANVEWTLIVGIDTDIAMQPVADITDTVEENIANILTKFFWLGLVLTVAALIFVKVFTGSIIKPLKLVAARMAELAGKGGDLTQAMEVTSHAELIELSTAFNQFREKVRDLLEQAKQSGNEVSAHSESTKFNAQQAHHHISAQLTEINSVVTAITEMSATAHEVATNASNAATNANTATDYMKGTSEEVVKVSQEVGTLSTDMLSVTTAVQAVAERSDDIKRILDVIDAIADQTNLLALNAAIEAARAGEHGRGFSVVADEVRALASKTADSVGDIGKVINSLQAEVEQTVQLIETGNSKAVEAAASSSDTASKMQEAVAQIEEINQHVLQIAAAAEEQSQVAEELNRNMVVVGDETNEVAKLSEASEQSAHQISVSVENLEQLLSKLKTS